MKTDNIFAKFDLGNWLQKSIQAIYDTFKRFPLTVIFFVSLASIFIYRIEIPYDQIRNIDEILDRVTAVLFLGVSLSLSVNMCLERMGKDFFKTKFGVYISELIVLYGYYHYLLSEINDVSVVKLTFTIAALLLGFIFIPYFFKRKNLEVYITNLISKAAISVFFTIVLALGIVAILFAIESLLISDLNTDLYAHTWILAFFVFAPIHFLYNLPKQNTKLKLTDYNNVIKIVLTYIVLPLLSVYTVVLYIYFAKILITQVWPEGIVSYLVSSYAAIGILTVFLLWPFRKNNKWIHLFTSVYTKLILPLLVMMFIAIGIRISHYGFTENRYFIVAIGAWATFVMVFINFNRGKNNIVFLISLSLILLTSVYGPVSAFNTSINSQNQRFFSILSSYNMIENDTVIKRDVTINENDRKDILSIISYFDDHHGLEKLRYLPEGYSLKDTKEYFGFDYSYDVPRLDRDYFDFIGINEPIKVSGYDLLFGFNIFNGSNEQNSNSQTATEQGIISVKIKGNTVTISRDEQLLYSTNIITHVEKLLSDLKVNALEKGTEIDLTFTDDNQYVSVKYIYSNIYGYRYNENGQIVVNNARGYLLVDLK